MSHFFDAHQALYGFHALAGSRLPHFSAAPQNQSTATADTVAPLSIDPDELDAAVRSVFGDGDLIFFAPAPDVSGSMASAATRTADEQHASGSGMRRLLAALGAAQARQALGEPGWVVLVAQSGVLEWSAATALLGQFAALRRFLLVHCGSGDSRLTKDASAVADYSGALAGFESLSAEAWHSTGRQAIEAALGRIKAQPRAAAIDLARHETWLVRKPATARGADAELLRHELSRSTDTTHPAIDWIAELAEADPRITILSLDAAADLAPLAARFSDRFFELPLGDADALAWCAGLADGGCRPLLCVAERSLAAAWPLLATEICTPQHAVKILCLAGSDQAPQQRSCSLPLLRLLSETPLVAPCDVAELRSALSFAVDYAGPVALWLSTELERTASGRHEAARLATGQTSVGLQLSRAEVRAPGKAADVVLLAWGDLVGPAERASQLLATVGVQAAVVNARFLQPLDAAGIVGAVRAAQACVVLDDRRWQSGFAAGVLEELAAAGCGTPTAVLWAAAERIGQDVPSAREHLALRVFDHCRWLSAPVVPYALEAPIVPEGPAAASKSLIGNWLGLSAERGRELATQREQVFARQLTPAIRRWAEAYQTVGSRDVYLWRWCLHGVELTTLPCVDPALRAHVCDTKVLSIVLCVLLDDVADRHGQGAVLEQLLSIFEGGASQAAGLTADERRHADVTAALWQEYQERVAGYPRQADYQAVLRYDLDQVFNALRYSHLVNHLPALLNLLEHDLYMPHNMMMVSFATLDLMCSPGFDQNELGTLREVVRHTECMGRIGNLLATWRRELADRDFTSGVFARALGEQDLTLDELAQADGPTIENRIRTCGHEEYFLRQWSEHREHCRRKARRLRSLDMRQTLAGHDSFLSMYLGSQGLI